MQKGVPGRGVETLPNLPKNILSFCTSRSVVSNLKVPEATIRAKMLFPLKTQVILCVEL